MERSSEIQDIINESVRLATTDPRADEALMRDALARFPDSSEIVIRAAVVLAPTAPDAGVELAERAAQIGGHDPAIVFRAASLFFALGEFDRASKYARQARELASPGFPLIFDLLHLAGKLALRKGDLAGAERALVGAFKHDPSTSGHGLVLARLYLDQGRHADALEVIARAREHRPHDGALAEIEREARLRGAFRS